MSGILQGCHSDSNSHNVEQVSSDVRPEACELFLADGANGAAIYDFSRQNDGYACDVGQKEAIIIPASEVCEEQTALIVGRGEMLDGYGAEAKLKRCNIAFSPHPPGGRFTTVVRLPRTPHYSEDVTNFQRELTDLVLRMPIGALYFTGASEFYCFQYENPELFLQRINDVRALLPDDVVIEHFTGAVCAAQMRSRFGFPLDE